MSMTIKQYVDHWISSSDESLKDMSASVKSKRHLNALYCGHQSIEKVLKALLAVRDTQIVYTHSVTKLAEKNNIILTQNQRDELNSIDQFYIVAKYGSVKSSLYHQCKSGSFFKDWIAIMRKWRKFLKKQVLLEKSALPSGKAPTYPEDTY